VVALDLAAELGRLVGDERRVSTSESVLRAHGEDLSYHAPRLPDVVVEASSTAEVSAVMRFANEHRIPVVPFGAGTSLEGHLIPLEGGISLDLMRMDRVLEVSPGDLLAVAQAGVTREQLNAAAVDHGLQFPVDPGANASLGGMAATSASGTTTVRYGRMRDQVLGLEVVLADGTVVHTGGRSRKSSAGYDLTNLMVGSEGTLGVITELTLRLHGIPEQARAARAVFPTIEAACTAAVAMVGVGLAVARVELVDGQTLRAVNAFKGTSYPEAPTLFLEFIGSTEGAAGDAAFAREICDDEGCTDWQDEVDEAARRRLWEARHSVAFAVMATAPGKKHKATDVAVPLSELPAAIAVGRAAVEREGITAGILGHVGDGNYHLALMIDPNDPDEVARAQRVNDEIVRDALARGGTCTGEHGIGLGKRGYLEAEHGDLLPLMRGIKQALDPRGILNPGKIV
jgi:D-lactate dehydrogenase (cytochrome)